MECSEGFLELGSHRDAALNREAARMRLRHLGHRPGCGGLAHDAGVDLAGFRRGVAEAGNETWGIEHEAETHVISPVADDVRT